MKNRSRSRKRTPWDEHNDLTATQEYLQMHYVARYEERHPRLADAGESDMVNSYIPAKCPYCSSDDFVCKGFDKNLKKAAQYLRILNRRNKDAFIYYISM